MKRILLISNQVLHYRIKIYNHFYHEFLMLGMEFHVLSNAYQEVDFPIAFKKHELPFGVSSYLKKVNQIKPDLIIFFLHLRDTPFFPLLTYCRFKHIPAIYWGHGVDLHHQKNRIKKSIYHFIHTLCKAIILYTPNELKFLSHKTQQKTFIAYNTQDFSDIEKNTIMSKSEVKRKYGIREDFVVLFISRILPYKGLDMLLEILSDSPLIGLVIVGPGISDHQLKRIAQSPNYYYLGEKYNHEVNEIFQMGDIFSTPGHIGLALNQAFFWGKPVVVLEGHHAPEIYYMQDGQTGYVVKNKEELKAKILLLAENPTLLASMSNNTQQVFNQNISISRMFSGFEKAVAYCLPQPFKEETKHPVF